MLCFYDIYVDNVDESVRMFAAILTILKQLENNNWQKWFSEYPKGCANVETPNAEFLLVSFFVFTQKLLVCSPSSDKLGEK